MDDRPGSGPSLRELASRVHRREIGARELVAESLRRIESSDPELGAVIAIRAEEALDEARGLDAMLVRGDGAGPLAGLPLLVKDISDVAGMRTTYGSLLYAEAPAARSDALVVQRLRAAGAIVVGKTNTPEFATEGYTNNLVFGPARNPWKPDRTPGGSSGGSAVAVVTGLAALATGTDTGGSVRIPAAYCGLVGLKPTNGLVPADPEPRVVPDWLDLTTDGPFGVCVDDVRLQLDVLAQPRSAHFPAEPSALFVLERWSDRGRLPRDVAGPFRAAVQALASVVDLEPEPIEPASLFADGDADDDWFAVAGPELVDALGGPERVAEMEDRLFPATASFLASGLRTTNDEYDAAQRRREGFRRRLDEVLGETGVLASPVMATDAIPAAGPDGEPRATGSELYVTQVQNLTGHPAISLPAGVHASGVPFGLQLTGPRFAEDLLLTVAAAWEAANPWPAVVPGYEPFGL